ncbi:MAG TPA: Sll0314/Alr1548 family TPR repeat-containing protein [Crinalium sp.]|jgi:tetratricopeptide (TPR) repeat protein
MASACQSPSPRYRHTTLRLKRIAATITGSVAIALSLVSGPAFAGDPFRATNPHAIDDQTEAAFKALFEQGNYVDANRLLSRPNSNEPLAYAIKASLAYLAQDNGALDRNATSTLEAAQRLVQTDPLRGHLYTAVGHFLEGAYALKTQGTLAATPMVLGKLQQVFDELQAAERIAPNDPELNLIKGYMDLMLAVNLPFANPNDAIQRLQSYAAPSYLAQRGIAIGYRDLRQPEQALAAVDRALAETPNNPDLFYLKAQILRNQNKSTESLEFFDRALQLSEQLPQGLVNQIAYEECRTRGANGCSALLRRTRPAS